ncbi:hypothetical protein NO135_20505, partial [Clostridioides difficile]|nr:hypothetical protein [Clostridioides difficile]
MTDWLAPGIVKQHRTLGTLVNRLIGSGFTLTHLDEWGPPQAPVDALPALAKARARPMLALVAARDRARREHEPAEAVLVVCAGLFEQPLARDEVERTHAVFILHMRGDGQPLI